MLYANFAPDQVPFVYARRAVDLVLTKRNAGTLSRIRFLEAQHKLWLCCLRQEGMLVVRGGVHADEGANTPARNRNPEREKAGITLRSTEHQLALAETCANKASVAREKKREEASVARERLRNAELLYVQVLSFLYPLFGL